MKNTVFVFGAGASFGSVNPKVSFSHNDDWKPPLTNGIFGSINQKSFDTIIKRFPSLGSMTTQIREYLLVEGAKADFESYIGDLINKSQTNQHYLTQVIDLRYYLRFLLKECSDNYVTFGSNYAVLIERLQTICVSSEVTFVTFNYDTLIENAFVERKCIDNFSEFDSYTKHIPFPLIKLHGSVNWVYKVPYQGKHFDYTGATAISGRLYASFNNLVETRNMDVIHWGDPCQETGYLYVPVIAVPTHGKAGFECPNEHELFLKSRLINADNIVCIGWKGSEDCFAKLCKEVRSIRDKQSITPAQKLIIVGTNEKRALEIMANMHNSYPLRQGKHIGGGFTGFLNEYKADKLNELLSEY